MWSLIRSPNYWKTKFPGVILLGTTGTVSGTVYQAGGVTPQNAALVKLCPGGPQTLSKSNGTFALYCIPIGRYRVLANNPAQTLEDVETIDVATNSTTTVTLVLDQTFKGC